MSRATHVNNSARLYNCSRCHSLVFICQQCDRGNIYCKECSVKANREAKSRAAARYQKTFQGRLNHAARQHRYREKLKQKVTHKGSASTRFRDLLIDKQKKVNPTFAFLNFDKYTLILCHSCNKQCSHFLRNQFLRRTA